MRLSDWRDQAACRGVPRSVFFPAQGRKGHGYDEARPICARCSVQSSCLLAAIVEERTPPMQRGDTGRGMRGGLTPAERDLVAQLLGAA